MQTAPYSRARMFWQVFFWANWLVILWFWWQGSGSQVGASLPLTLIAAGRLVGLSAAYLILRQFFLMGRMPWLERVFGLDKLARMHHKNGRWGLLFLLIHPTLITLGYSMLAGVSYFQQQQIFITQYKHVLWAVVGLTLFVIVAGTSIFLSLRKRFKYETWYFVHLLAYLAVFASFWHQIEWGEDLVGNQLFYWYWVALYSTVFTSHLVFRFLRPVYNYFRFGFQVNRIVPETHNTASVYISGRNLEKFRIYPGQFMILRFLTRGLWWQAHPFSLSLMPNGKELRVTIKNVGDFTSQIPQVPVGTKLMIDGPYGIFTEFFSVSSKVLFIAGGIGITPIRSLMEAMARHKKDVALLYSNRTEQDIVFKKELEDVTSAYGGSITHVISDDPNYPGEQGRLDEEKIKRLVPDILSREVYLCGPPPMMDAVRQTLAHLGVPQSHIHFEAFSLH